MMELGGRLTLFDRDMVDATNLNRSPLFTVLDALTSARGARRGRLSGALGRC